MNALNIGKAAVILGAGRERKEDPIDLSVGIIVHKKIGEYVKINDPLFTIYANNQNKISIAKKEALKGIQVSKKTKIETIPLHYDVIE